MTVRSGAAEQRSCYITIGGILLLVQIALIAFLLSSIASLDNRIIGWVIPIYATSFTIGYLLYLHPSEERPWVLIASLLFSFMGACLVLGSSVVRADIDLVFYFVAYGFQIGWMGVILLISVTSRRNREFSSWSSVTRSSPLRVRLGSSASLRHRCKVHILTPSVRAISLSSFPCLAKSFACASFVATSTLAACPAAVTSISFTERPRQLLFLDNLKQKYQL